MVLAVTSAGLLGRAGVSGRTAAAPAQAAPGNGWGVRTPARTFILRWQYPATTRVADGRHLWRLHGHADHLGGDGSAWGTTARQQANNLTSDRLLCQHGH